MEPDRLALLTAALRLSFFTIAWNGVVGAAALVVSFLDGSLALAGLALNALLDSGASAVLVWRFKEELRDPVEAERLERHAHSWIVVAMGVIGVYVGLQAIRGLVGGAHPEASALAVILASVSLAVLPWLGRMKLRVASGLESRSLRGDGILTAAAAALAAVTLAALLVNSTLDWWWADPIAALLIAVVLAAEATRMARS